MELEEKSFLQVDFLDNSVSVTSHQKTRRRGSFLEDEAGADHAVATVVPWSKPSLKGGNEADDAEDFVEQVSSSCCIYLVLTLKGQSKQSIST